MDIPKVGRIISQRFSISSLITFGLFLVLTVTVLYFDARTRRIEEIASANRFMFKKSLNVKPDDTAETGVGSLSTQQGEQPVLLLQALCMKNRFPSKKSLDDNPVQTPKPAPGSLYTRWGRTTCPRHSTLVYDGVVGGQFYLHTGGGSNLLCLPNDPIWANYTEEVEKYTGYIYGSEYQVYTHTSKKLFSFANAEAIDDHNAPCAVCMTRQPAVVMMLPARTQCYPGWTAEYSGYLMSMRYDRKGRYDYVCVDHAPEADPAGHRDEDGALLYFVQARCGSLPCPPYVEGREISCVVCSKY